ncbi:MAG: tRNA uridine-5-carboxymethylaminomethyl(34) synthesis GTPase MnmE [Paracoccaceae bacterium]|nr:tRNA uridine-5-carboxymethylaminomethyl(34) synthesis GTPase MnmE [Paracoccaceae bacterium]
MDTVFAMSTAPGKAGVAVLRLSGPAAHEITEGYAGTLPPPRELRLRRLHLPCGGLLDEALVVVFDAGQSFTGEPVAEWHLHGSIAVQRKALAALGAEPGLRPAEAGEFTRRALQNERLDLVGVEGLADLIDAETEVQHRRALAALGGQVSKKIGDWRADLVRAAALVEATIDFADEDIPEDVFGEVSSLLGRTKTSLTEELAGSPAAERLRQGFEVAIVGAPNVGKSTLLNRLAGRDAAITSDVAGTTRDVIEVRMEIAGLPVTLLDTAGLRETDDPIETIGVDRARSRAATADIRVVLLGPGDGRPAEALEDDIVLTAKSDTATSLSEGVSGLTGAGVDALVAELGHRLQGRTQSAGIFDRERHRIAARDALEALDRAEVHVEEGPHSAELAAEELRAAARALEGLLGQVGVEDLLHEIFSSFCIGK